MKTHLKAVPAPQHGRKQAILEILGLRKVFEINGSFHTVLENINLSADGGELICILGRSGCGKSTLLKILAGFISPSSGTLCVNGKPVTHPGPDRCVVFQEDTLFPWLTVQENIAFGLKGKRTGKKAVKKEVDRYLSLVGLSEFENYIPGDISGGMKQRVALARVLILKPAVLLMDEPFASLDAQTREEMQNLLLSIWSTLAHTILFVTHDVNEAVTLADRILIMGNEPGRIKEELSVGLPRPRKQEMREFLELSRRLHEYLRD